MEINDQPATSQNDLPADVSTEPSKAAFPVLAGRKPARSITYRWVVSTDDAGTEVLVELACHHAAPRYVAHINNKVRKPNGSVLYAPLDARLVLTEQVSRYAKATFTAFAERALAELRRSADRPEIAAYPRGAHRLPH